MTIAVDHRFVEKTLIDLVQIPSENPPGSNIEIVNYLVELAEKEGLPFERQQVAKQMENVFISPSEDVLSSRKIALVGHLDTVPVGENWTKDPFGKDRDGDILYGRGASDMKAGVAAFLAVIKTLNHVDTPLEITPVFVGTVDEEVLMRGAEQILRHKGILGKPEFALIGEPTDLQLGIAEKGCLHLRVHTKGVAAHGSRPELGANAIDACYEIINQIKKMMPTEPDITLGKATQNLGWIRGGTKANIVPNTCEAQLDIRFGPSHDHNHLLEKMVNEACESIEKPCVGKYEIIQYLAALETERNHSFIQQLSKELENVGQKPKYCGLTYATDAAILIPEWNIPFLIFGPGDQAALHIADEWVSLQQTTTAAQVISNALLSYCS